VNSGIAPGRLNWIDMSETEKVDWKTHGVQVIPRDCLDPNTAQTPGMSRAAAIDTK
jgi:uncharacterized RmlC-like cupin family protein